MTLVGVTGNPREARIPRTRGVRFRLWSRQALREALVEAVDERGRLLELADDDAHADLAEVVRLDAESFPDSRDHLRRRDAAVAVDDVVQVAGRQAGLLREGAVRHARLGHQLLDRRAERVARVCPFLRRHQSSMVQSITDAPDTRVSWVSNRRRTSTEPSSSDFFPTVTRSGQPSRSASANFSPGRASRSSRSTLRPEPERSSATPAAMVATSLDPPASDSTCASYGATERGQTMPRSSWPCSTIAASTRPGPMP